MAANKFSFSVVIPVCNGAEFITKAIHSCLQQTVLPEEIIIVDDASNDDTGEIVMALGSNKVRYVRNEQNYGPSYSRNRGMKMAVSNWILFLDADDVFHPHKIDIVRYCIENNDSIRALGHAFGLVHQPSVPLTDKWEKTLPVLKRFSGNDVLWRNPMVTPSLAVAASNHIFFNEEIGYAEDHDFILRTAEKFGIYYLNMPLCSLSRLPLTAGGISSHIWKMRRGEMRMFIDYCKRHKLYVALPFLLLFSLLKHARNLLILPLNNK